MKKAHKNAPFLFSLFYLKDKNNYSYNIFFINYFHL